MLPPPVEKLLARAVQAHQAGRLAEAEAFYRQILGREANHPDALHNLGVIAHQVGCHELARDLMLRALVLQPGNPAIGSNLGEVSRALGLFDEAITAFQRTLAMRPDLAEVHGNLARALNEQGRFPEAVAASRRALELDATLPEAHCNLANALTDLGRFDEALGAYEHARKFRSDFAQAKFNESLLLLLRGDYERAWPLYEARWASARLPEREFPQPRWDGGPLYGRRILIHAEQGFGDAIQFIRYAQLLADRGGEVIVECVPALVDLFRTALGVNAVVATGERLPAFDLHLPMLSLPLLFRTTPATIPREVPYLFADAIRRKAWHERLAVDQENLKIGLVWTGNPKQSVNRARSLEVSQLLPLLEITGAKFFSLQLGGAEQIKRFAGGKAIVDLTPQIYDFADTAAFVTELDLIISTDTSVPHLAGAIGRPVWTLLQWVPDWRWGLEGETCPWYPTMRLFRQPAAGDWTPVILQVATALKQWLRGVNPDGRSTF
jgi:tetratricopeptide (TPR) repeat protein